MQVILLQDVKSLGKKGQLVKVNDGYARNFILPKKLGVEATSQNLYELEQQKKKEEEQQLEILNTAKALKEKIEAKTVEVKIKAGDGGRTFGSVSTKEIAQAANTQLGFEVDKKKMVLAEPIKTLGTHEIVVKLHPQVSATLKVHVSELK